MNDASLLGFHRAIDSRTDKKPERSNYLSSVSDDCRNAGGFITIGDRGPIPGISLIASRTCTVLWHDGTSQFIFEAW